MRSSHRPPADDCDLISGYPGDMASAAAHIKQLADAGHATQALTLVSAWAELFDCAVPLHQLRLRLLRENGASPPQMERSLRALEKAGQLQSWRDVASLAELEAARGQPGAARDRLVAQLAALRGRPRQEEAREALRTLLASVAKRARPHRPAAMSTKPTTPPPVTSAASPTAPQTKTEAMPATTIVATAATVPTIEDVVDVPIAVVVEAAPDLMSALDRPAGPDGLAERALVLRAHRVAVADRFDELLCLGSMHGVERMSHQVETVKRALRMLRGRALLADEVGLGKTIEAGMFLAECQLRGLVDSALVVVPASLVGQWREELQAKFGLVFVTTEDEECRADPTTFWTRHPRIIASLETARSARHADTVASRTWDLVILDEAHRLKNRNTAGWRLADQLRSRFLLLLTATPVENDLTELYTVVDLLRPGQLATLAEFKRRFMTRGSPTEPRNTEALRQLLAEVMIRNTRSLVDLRLPPRFARTVRIPFGPAEAELYGRVTELLRRRGANGGERLAIATLLEEAGSSPLAVEGTCARMLARGDLDPTVQHALTELQACARAGDTTRKATALLEIVRQARANGEKTVVFSRFRRTLEYLVEFFRRAEIPFSAVHGGLGGPDKDTAVAAFWNEVPVLLASEVGGEGRNLQCASTLVNYDLPWNPMRLEQRIGRLHRIGQTREVHIHNLCAQGSVEERILDVLDRRINLFELVVGELDMILGRVGDERDFDARVVEIIATSRDDDDVARGFELLGDELEAARRAYSRTKELDRRLFGREFEA